jgi:hypothetical protein
VPAGTPAYTVTSALLAQLGIPEAAVDAEEAEYAALTVAAEASLHLLEQASAERRRLVLAVDAGIDAAFDDPTGSGETRLGESVTMAQVSAVHADTPDAADLVDQALAALERYEDGDGAERVLIELAELDLAWYAPDEISQLL